MGGRKQAGSSGTGQSETMRGAGQGHVSLVLSSTQRLRGTGHHSQSSARMHVRVSLHGALQAKLCWRLLTSLWKVSSLQQKGGEAPLCHEGVPCSRGQKSFRVPMEPWLPVEGSKRRGGSGGPGCGAGGRGLCSVPPTGPCWPRWPPGLSTRGAGAPVWVALSAHRICSILPIGGVTLSC